MFTISRAVAGLLATTLVASAAEYTVHSFKKIQLTDKFWSEGANFGDFNHDGKMDVVSGPYWWEGPAFKVRHEYYETKSRKSSGGAAPFKKKLPDATEETVEGFEEELGSNNAYSDN